MAEEIAKQSDELVSARSFHATAVGLEVIGEPTYEEWLDFGLKLGRVDGAIQWWIGDWAAAEGRVKKGVQSEAYDFLEEQTGLARNTVRKCKNVASSVNLDLRRSRLSWTHHEAVAALSPTEQDSWLGEAEANDWSASELKREIRQARNGAGAIDGECDGGFWYSGEEGLQKLLETGLQFGAIYIDPPWKYSNQSTRAATDNHYSTLTVDEIAELPVAGLSAEKSHLHLWTTNAFLSDALRLLETWGYEYRGVFVWAKGTVEEGEAKPQIGIGNYWRVSHEFMVLGIRGGVTFLDKSLPSWLMVPRKRHSKKPDEVRALVERASPGPRLEMFARVVSPGWHCWGDEVTPGLFDKEG